MSLQIVLTVSPVRHTREGIAENSLSKSTLICAVHEIVEEFGNVVFYFPSYEIFIDELRYADDACCTVLCCAMLCCTVLCCAVLCYAVQCSAVLCCTVLCCVIDEGDTYQCGSNSARLWVDFFLSECMCVYMYQCVYVFVCLCVFMHQFVPVCMSMCLCVCV
jgi:GSCFA family